jgi:PHD-zinc-finger like domain
VHKTVCELCQNVGGAYKALDKPGKWIHSLCASWIPEIYFLDSKKTSLMTTSRLDKKRFRLKCALCSGKGACIECKHGKCRTAAHPWCVLHNPCGFTKRVIKDENNTMVWDIFCKTHASSVSEPLKPKPKSKIVQQLAAAPIPGSEIVDEKVKEKERIAKKALLASKSLPKLSMAHSVRKASTSVPKKPPSESVTDLTMQRSQETSNSTSTSIKDTKPDPVIVPEMAKDLTKSPPVTGKKIRGPYKKKGTSQTKGGDDDQDSEKKDKSVEKEKIKDKDKEKDREKEKEKYKVKDKDRDREQEKEKPGSINKVQFELPSKLKQAIKSDVTANEIIELETDPTLSSQASRSFTIQTLNEWPGQSEGEAMDLEHFWNVAAMQYPEDHSVQVSKHTLHCCCIILQYIVLYHFIVHYVTSHHITSHHIVLFCAVLQPAK